jgi:hypothetical protein
LARLHQIESTDGFKTNIPHQKITTDTTEFKYYEVDAKGRMNIKKLYLDPFMDVSTINKIQFHISNIAENRSISAA